MNKLNKTILLAVLLLTTYCISPKVFAQGPGFDEDVEDVPVPFDGGVALVAALAVGYGVKKIRDRKKEQER